MYTVDSLTKDPLNESKTAILEEEKNKNTWMNTVDSTTKDHLNQSKTAILEERKK